MCGIVGVVGGQYVSDAQIEQAEKLQRHRGPDSQGVVRCMAGVMHITLIHQRLSILDLSDAGSQPMKSRDGAGWLIYNGEIFNFIEIRTELESLGHSFCGHSDTEVLLAALEYWGEEGALSKLNGMWAFAWLDERKQRLVLARDRFGVKPLYYYLGSDGLYFSSEIKTILGLSGRKFQINEDVVNEYLMQFSADTTDATFFKDIHKVPSASYSVIDLKASVPQPVFKRYWDIDWAQADTSVSNNEKIEGIRELFYDAVRLRLRSDVPVGVLLSGGVDSSAIAAAMSCLLGDGKNLLLLAAVSDDPNFDETVFIDKMAEDLGKEVHKVKLQFDPKEAKNYLEKVTWHNDEPCGGFSNVAQYQLMQKARELGIKVLLSGQGADEAFCGYKKYIGFYVIFLLRQGCYFQAIRVLYDFWRNGTVINQFRWGEAKRYLPKWLQPKRRDVRGSRLFGKKIRSGIGMLKSSNVAKRQWLDVCQYSVPLLTHYEDRMSMAWSCEVRNPFLDYRLMEAALCLPINLKLSHGWTKYALRKAMDIDMPSEIVWRKDKKGFSNPESEWLKTSLSGMVNDYFGEGAKIFESGLINRDELIKVFERYKRQSPNSGSIAFREIWGPLSLEIWMRQFGSYLII